MNTFLAEHRRVAAEVMPEPALFIGQERVHTTAHGTRDRIDPSTGELLASFPIAGAAEVDAAVQAAWAAYPEWRALGADKRRRLMFKLADTIRQNTPELARIHALETGTPVSQINYESRIDFIEYYAGWADKFEGELAPTYPAKGLNYVKYEPYGVVAALATWNGPIASALKKLGPALASGNCVILKAPELGPFALMRLMELFLEAGLPHGVVNLLVGNRVTTQEIVKHPGVRKISFTGGPTTAKAIMELAAESLTPVTLELGGKSANIVFPDADLDRAAEMAVFMSTIANAGQGCLFPTRLLVHESVYSEFLDRAVAIAAKHTRFGSPLDSATGMGPVIDAGAAESIYGYIEDARDSARVVSGGDRVGGSQFAGGSFVPPTIIADVDPTSRLATEEVFGPVLAAMPFSSEDEALTIANSTEFGLAGYVHTKDLARAHRVADQLDAGYIGVNAFPPANAAMPFGGVKASGFGREGGRAGIEEYVHHKNIFVSLDD